MPWKVVITEWALNSYLELKGKNVFTAEDYKLTLRPDIELLRCGIPPTDPKFEGSKFWGPAKLGSNALPSGYKMKWHNLGPGRVQMRLPVHDQKGKQAVLLCEAYVKSNELAEKRKMARFKTHMNLISQGKYYHRGEL